MADPYPPRPATSVMAEPLVTNRLHLETYKRIEQEVSRIGIPKDGTEAAYLLGIQAVLSLLRNKYTSGL